MLMLSFVLRPQAECDPADGGQTGRDSSTSWGNTVWPTCGWLRIRLWLMHWTSRPHFLGWPHQASTQLKLCPTSSTWSSNESHMNRGQLTEPISTWNYSLFLESNFQPVPPGRGPRNLTKSAWLYFFDVFVQERGFSGDQGLNWDKAKCIKRKHRGSFAAESLSLTEMDLTCRKTAVTSW